MKKLLFLMLLTFSLTALAGTDSVILKLVPGHSFDAAREELKSAGCILSAPVVKDKTDTLLTVKCDQFAQQIIDIYDDPSSTDQEITQLETTLFNFFSSMIHTDYIGVDKIYFHKYEGGQQGVIDAQFMSDNNVPLQYRNNGNPSATNPYTAIIDGGYANSWYNPASMSPADPIGHIDAVG